MLYRHKDTLYIDKENDKAIIAKLLVPDDVNSKNIAGMLTIPGSEDTVRFEYPITTKEEYLESTAQLSSLINTLEMLKQALDVGFRIIEQQRESANNQ